MALPQAPAATASDAISPTAYATGELWQRLGLSHPALSTARGRRLDRVFRVLLGAIERFSGVSMEALMQARHRGIDAQLSAAIDSGQVSQVIEIAAGLSPRGWRFGSRYGAALTYVETDLPAMATLKRELCERAGWLGDHHRVVTLDALADSGPASLAAVAASLDPRRGTAIITEGLVNYFDLPTAQRLWRRIADTLGGFDHGVYLADIYPQPPQQRLEGLYAGFGRLLGAFVKGRISPHFSSAPHAVESMMAAGFVEAEVIDPAQLPATRDYARIKGGDRVQILQARSRRRN